MEMDKKKNDYEKMTPMGNFIIGVVEIPFDEALEEAVSETGVIGAVREYAKENGTVPYITVADKNGMWQMFVLYGTSMYNLLKTFIDDGEGLKDADKEVAEMLFTHMFMNSTLVGDPVYYNECAEATAGFIKRIAMERQDEK